MKFSNHRPIDDNERGDVHVEDRTRELRRLANRSPEELERVTSEASERETRERLKAENEAFGIKIQELKRDLAAHREAKKRANPETLKGLRGARSRADL